MNQTARLEKLISDHYDGDPWIDVTITGTLKKITASQAAKKIDNFNSIWQIVNHMIAWRETLLKRLKEETITTPENNFIDEIRDTSKEVWQKTLKRLEHSQKDILSFLSTSKDSTLEKISLTSGYSYYELMEAILVHDAYHLGQIVLFKKLI